jgi:hypothetical protein
MITNSDGRARWLVTAPHCGGQGMHSVHAEYEVDKMAL